MPDLTRVWVRATPEQVARWKELAAAQGRTLSNWIRWVLETRGES